jgi:DNA polymerase-1
VGFESASPTFRHELFEDYKGHRQKMPDDIVVNIPYIKSLVDAFGIPLLQKDGFEADDVIGTIATRAAAAGFEVYMMTMDKDYGQLVKEHVYLYKPSYMGKGVEVMGVPEILNRWGIQDVDQVRDILGLQGDASDNIPGIPGVGEKTAQKLIQEYGSIENLVANADKLAGKQKELVTQHAEQALLSKQLATIDVHVPVEFDEDKLRCTEPNKETLSALLDDLEFRSIKKRIFGEETVGPAAASYPCIGPGRPGPEKRPPPRRVSSTWKCPSTTTMTWRRRRGTAIPSTPRRTTTTSWIRPNCGGC